MIKLLIELRFYAVGTFYQAIADMFGVSRGVIQAIISEVSFLIATKLRDDVIVMPETQQDLLNAKVDFMRWSGFPICIGAVDGTHVSIQSYGGPDSEVYRNRKMVFSLNCQFTVSADERIIDVVSRWPGSAHDSTIFTHSQLYNRLTQGDFGNDSVIVADSAYPPLYFICKPLEQVNGVNQQDYQYKHFTVNVMSRNQNDIAL
ncbi:putative nuclease HARBI1 [Sitodiplosis mosellana]|uniref:putative nuclease HARBI1 n=1 Tax=Sitodiplosis mosellana TaxID=263140 RepID=UPI002444AB30|nr:putative nuclease HARBI1 [Sitodiplosis mosellana]